MIVFYLHKGAVKSLDQLVRVMALTQIGKVPSNRQVEDIVALLKSLTGVPPSWDD